MAQVLGSFCQSLAFNYGLRYASAMGTAYQSFLATSCWCLMTTVLLLFSYVFSEKSSVLVRQSLFVSYNLYYKRKVYINDISVSVGDDL